VDPGLHHLQGKTEGVGASVSEQSLADLIRDFYLERVAQLMRHEDVALFVTDYDINNAYQYIIAREQTHLSWLQHALLDLGAPLPNDPARGPKLSVKGDGWKSLAGDDAATNAKFVEQWRPRVDAISNARHKGMLKVILGEMLEHKRLFDQAAQGRRDLIGKSLDINDHSGDVMSARFVGDI
jgi:Mn-containing catalase